MQNNKAVAVVKSDFMQSLNKIESHFDDIIGYLPNFGDDDLSLLYEYLKKIGQSAWKAQCAVIFEAKNRGVNIDSIARDFGISKSQAYRDVQIFERFLANGDPNNIDDKTFYQLALTAPDPVAALNHADDRRNVAPSYSTRDFQKYLKGLKKVGEKGGVKAEVNFNVFPTYRDADYLDFIRSLPCCATHAQPAEPHHIEAGGVGMKCSDYLTIPLSRAVHKELTAVGGGKDVLLEKYNVDAYKVALRCVIEYLHSVV